MTKLQPPYCFNCCTQLLQQVLMNWNKLNDFSLQYRRQWHSWHTWTINKRRERNSRRGRRTESGGGSWNSATMYVVQFALYMSAFSTYPSHASALSASTSETGILNANELFLYIFRDWGIKTHGGIDTFFGQRERDGNFWCWIFGFSA